MRRPLLAATLLAFALAGCDSDRRAISRDDLPDVPDVPDHVVVIDDDGIDIDELDVLTSDLVEFRIQGDADRSVRARLDDELLIDTGLLFPGETTIVVFDRVGTWTVDDGSDASDELVVTSTQDPAER